MDITRFLTIKNFKLLKTRVRASTTANFQLQNSVRAILLKREV